MIEWVIIGLLQGQPIQETTHHYKTKAACEIDAAKMLRDMSAAGVTAAKCVQHDTDAKPEPDQEI